MIHIAICTDDNYLIPVGVLMTSICENNSQSITFHIVSLLPLKEKTKEAFQRITTQYKKDIRFYNKDLNKLNLLPEHQNGQLSHVSIAAYLRLFLGDILPQSLQKVLYLDCDMIVVDDITPIWETNISKAAIACVPDAVEGDITYINNLHYSPAYGYFNSGVLLINLNYWRENGLVDKFIKFIIENPEKLRTLDQDVLNGILYNSKINLPLRFNVQYHHFLKIPQISWELYEDQLAEAKKYPCIIHFTTPRKPWFYPCQHPLTHLFIKYKNMTEWKDVPSGKKLSFKSRMKFFLQMFGVNYPDLNRDNRLNYNL